MGQSLSSRDPDPPGSLGFLGQAPLTHTLIHSTVMCAAPCTRDTQKKRSPCSQRAPSPAQRQSVAGNGPGVKQVPSFPSPPQSCPEAIWPSTRALCPDQEPRTESAAWGLGTRAKSSPPPSTIPSGTHAPPGSLQPSPPRPPTVGEGAIRDVEGAHGDAHKDQELKEPKPVGRGEDRQES